MKHNAKQHTPQKVIQKSIYTQLPPTQVFIEPGCLHYHCTINIYFFFMAARLNTFQRLKDNFFRKYSLSSLSLSLLFQMSNNIRCLCNNFSHTLGWIYLFSFQLSMPSRRPLFIFLLIYFFASLIDNKNLFSLTFFCLYLILSDVVSIIR